ncbi:unnamed protein product [Effrenium voratum]|uniref:Uncharacterized protein n=1 Tax=Effrenium voratum TaxID=2562239 RepID=A0AA36IDP0_9DINO|nr:unnamed protein product [Effrenium voratum]CAJ1457647.1 unnamed protein product [Effrenium voratum]
MVVANLKKEVLRTLKIVQVCILRIVTFELLREQAAKALRKGKGKKAEVPQEGVTYLASDITSLAKVIQHFRFDQTFTKGVHELIVSFRKQKAEKPKPAKGAAPPRKRPADSGPEPAEPPPGAGGEETQAAENGDADQASPKEDLQAAEGTDADAGEGQPSKKKPRIVS